MNADNLIISSSTRPDLSIHPHVLSVLEKLFDGEEQPALSEQEELTAHLEQCHHCRTALLSLLSETEEQEKSSSGSGKAAHDLLVRFANIHSALAAHEDEQIGAYAEMVMTRGYDAADHAFPKFAAHLKTCSDCRLLLETSIAFLRNLEEMS